MKCVYCKKGDNSCYYTKNRIIYSYCGDIKDSIGVGSKLNPINYNRINELDFDELILKDEYYSIS